MFFYLPFNLNEKYPIWEKLSRPLLMLLWLWAWVFISFQVSAQTIAFDESDLKGESSNNPTSLQFGPDSRLYVAQQDGTIYVYTIQRNGPKDYQVIDTETINIIKNQIPNHNDDGASNATKIRQITGILVEGTASKPVLYVSSSDWRIAIGNDSNLDTNSGIISRLTWKGNGVNDPNGFWEKIDLVRGLPRCEENHSTNGMVLDKTTNTLYVMSGGHTNKGAPGKLLAAIPEYALSAALLSVDMNVIDNLPVYTDPRTNTKYVYDLPTLDDPTRPNISKGHPAFPYPAGHPMHNESIDLHDPFGGNDGLNQARLVKNGPVQIYSPGYRNAYDIVLTESGKLYTFDNGPNANWGGTPLLFDANGNPKGTGPWQNGDKASNELNETNSADYGDGLHYITGKGYYGGHPNPTRANPLEAGLYIYGKPKGYWELTDTYDFVTDFPELPVPADMANPIEGHYQPPIVGPGGNAAMAIINSSTNGMDEYTASNFNGAMKGQLLAASYNGNVHRFKLNAAGTAVVEHVVEFDNIGVETLDVTSQGDNDIFPGTVWIANYGDDRIIVAEPKDGGSTGACPGPGQTGYQANADSDGDGYTNQDEIQNGTNHCSGGSKPTDFDGDFVSDLLDEDDDNDGIPDLVDAFAHDASNGLSTNLPIDYPFTNSNPGTGFFGLGFTGLMANGTTDYLDMYDVENLAAGGAGGKFTIEKVPTGDTYGKNNSQKYAFQFGVNVDQSTAPFTVHSSLDPPFFWVDGNPSNPKNFQNWGIYIGKGDQDNFFKVVFIANNGLGGIEVMLEQNGNPVGKTYGPDVVGNLLNASAVDIFISVNPAQSTAQPYISIDGGSTKVAVGSPVQIPASWLSANDNQGLAVGVISTSIVSQKPFTATWDFIEVKPDQPQQVESTTAKALVEVSRGAGQKNNINASTFNPNAFVITNQSPDGHKITKVEIDARTAWLPNVAFDPDGTAGDPVGKGFDPNFDSGVGLAGHTLSAPIGNGGFQVITVNFNDFTPNKIFGFSIDQDPTSVEGLPAPGPSDAGSISGLEMIGATVKITFDNNTTYTGRLYSNGSVGGSEVLIKANPLPAPSISVNGGSPATTNQANQTIQVSGGQPNGKVSLFRVEAAQFDTNPPSIDFAPFEANSAIQVQRLMNIDLNGNGSASVPVTLTDSDPEGGYNHILVAQQDGNFFGLTSNIIILEYDQNATPPTTFNLNLSTDGNGTAAVSPKGPYTSATNISVSANPNNGFQFVGWTNGVGSMVSTANPYNFTITQNATLKANFAPIQQPGDLAVTSFTLVNADNNQDLLTINDGTVINLNDLPTQNLNIRTNASGSPSFVGTTLTGPVNQNRTEGTAPFSLFGDLNGNYVAAQLPAGNYTLTGTPAKNGVEGTSLTVNFSIVDQSAPVTYSLNLSTDGNGSASASPASGPYAAGTSLTLTANPNQGFVFDSWTNGSGNTVSTANPYTFNINQNTTLQANFVPTQQPGDLAVTSFTLINADNNQDLLTINDGAVINLAELPTENFNIRTNASGSPSYVGATLTGPVNQSRTEGSAPFALFGDVGGDYLGAQLLVGNYTLSGTPSKNGVEGASLTVNFSIVNQSTPVLAVEQILLINADTDQTVGVIQNGSNFNIPNLGVTNLTLVATTNPSIVGSVQLQLSGAVNEFRNENLAPYSLYGDNGSTNYDGTPLTAGDYTITATAFTEKSGAGNASAPLTFNFSLNRANNNGPAVTSILLIDADADVVLATLQEGAEISVKDLGSVNLGIQAITNPTTVGSVQMQLSGAASVFRNENLAPYSIYGDAGPGSSNFDGALLGAGDYTISATAFTGKSGAGEAGATNTINFTLKDAEATGPVVTEIRLINADTDQMISTIQEGANINVAGLGTTNLAIQAVTNPATVGSVQMELSGAASVFRNENLGPYSLYGDAGPNSTDFDGAPLEAGNYTITATAYSERFGAGEFGPDLTLNFTLSGVAAKSATPVVAEEQAVEEPTLIPSLAIESVYPNPIQGDQVTVELKAGIQGNITYYILDTKGYILSQGNIENANTISKFKVDLADLDLKEGAYYLRIQSEGQSAKTHRLLNDQ